MTKDKKTRIALIAICVVLFIIIILFIFSLISNKGQGGKSKIDGLSRLNGVYLGEDLDFEMNSLSSERCIEDNTICIMGLEIITQGNKGTITYIVRNNSDEAKTGKLKITIGNNDFVFPYNNVPPYDELAQKEKREVYGYEGFDLDFTTIDDYTVEAAKGDDESLMFENMTNDEKEEIDVN